MERQYENIIIGIDPGTNVMGYALLGINGKTPELIVMGVLQLSRMENHYMRLRHIYERVSGVIEEYLPDEMAIEAPFYGKNVQSMLKLGRAQGVAMVAALNREIPITEYEPRKIKMAITGNGAASNGCRPVPLLRAQQALHRQGRQILESLHCPAPRPRQEKLRPLDFMPMASR